MAHDDFFSDASRRLQDRFDTRRLADRLAQLRLHRRISARDRVVIDNASMVMLATADARGRPDCSYKGGVPGFIRIVNDSTLELPSYDGNGMFRSLGNIADNPQVGLLFVDFGGGTRLRCNGRAQLVDEPSAVARFRGAQLVVRIHIEQLFPNCGRYVHPMESGSPSPDAPRPGHEPPAAAWKDKPEYAGALPRK